MMQPVRTPRLEMAGGELRRWTQRDSARLVAAWRDPQIAAWNPVPSQPDVATATRWIAGVADREEHGSSLDWVIDLALRGGVVGEVGLSGFSADHNGALIGYWLLPEARGCGLASTSVAAVTQWAHRELGLSMIVARCHPDNAASGAVVARVGYRNERRDSSGHDLWISRTRES